jgi:hypothetical protein
LIVAPARYQDCFTRFREEVDSGDVKLFFADSVDSVTRIFEAEEIGIVFVGGSSGWEDRLEILQHILANSPTTSVHCKGKDKDPYWFIGGILKGLAEYNR